MARSPLLPGPDEETVAEVNLALTSKRASARGAALPIVVVSEDQIESVLSQSIPVAKLMPGTRPALGGAAGAGAAGGGEAQQGSALEGVLAAVGAAVQAKLGISLPWLLRPRRSGSELPPPALVAWHTQRQWLAVGHPASDTVLVYDLEGTQGGPDHVSEAKLVLVNELQRGVAALAWRPVHCSMVAAGVTGGAVLWGLGRAPAAAAGGGGGAAAAGAAANGGGNGGAGGQAWATFLRYVDGCRVTSLAWSPDGQRLAGSGPDSSAVVVWDAALGSGAVVRFGLDPLPLLRWSPCGGYLFAAGAGGRFYVAETSQWRTASWEAPPGACATAAAWAPSGKLLLVAFGGGAAASGGSVVAIHFVGGAPSLAEQVLPVTLQEVTSLDALASEADATRRTGGSGGGAPVADMAWDAAGRRLAVLLRAPHPAAGLVAIYSTSAAPVLHADLIGFARPFKGGGGGGAVASALAFAPRPAGRGAVLSVMGRPGGAGSPEVVVSNIALGV